MRAFRARFPAVTELTPWNEPNHHMRGSDGVDSNPAADPALAAAYWNVMREECPRCTVAAGDLLAGPGGAGMRRWLRAYAGALAAPPAAWAVHPYTAVSRADRRSLDAFLAGTGTAPVWITEVGAQHCIDGVAFGDAGQDAAARRLLGLLAATAPRVERAYYYNLAGETGCAWDTALLAPDGQPRPALLTLFPATAEVWWSRVAGLRR